jgi:N-acetylglucosamine malate deacetylase 1
VKKIMAIGAHADDVEIGMGGTIARHVKEGDEVAIVCAIIPCESHEGEASTEAKIRRRDAALNAAKTLKAQIEICNLSPYEFKADRKHTKMFDAIVRNYAPDVVYVNWHKDSHQDHRAMADIVFSAARKNTFSLYMYSSMIYGGIVPAHFSPQFYVNVTNVYETKMAVLKEYFDLGLLGPTLSEADCMCRYFGAQIGVKYAEGHEIVKEIKF